MVLSRDKDGICKEVSYINFNQKCIYNGDELGSRCDRHAVQKLLDRDKVRQEQELQLKPSQRQTQRRRLRQDLY